MDEYIEREAAYKTLTAYYHHSTEFQHDALREALNRVPTADVVEVVRCRECTMADDCSDEREMYCTLYHKYRPCDYFCADGEGR